MLLNIWFCILSFKSTKNCPRAYLLSRICSWTNALLDIHIILKLFWKHCIFRYAYIAIQPQSVCRCLNSLQGFTSESAQVCNNRLSLAVVWLAFWIPLAFVFICATCMYQSSCLVLLLEIEAFWGGQNESLLLCVLRKQNFSSHFMQFLNFAYRSLNLLIQIKLMS